MNQKDLARFERSVAKTEACWLWTGTVRSDGYGVMSVGGRGGRIVAAHRLAYEHYVRAIPSLAEHHGFCVCHICDVRACVNPEHLFIAPQRVNLLDAQMKGRLRGRRAKLSDEDVREMRRLYAVGDTTTQEIADRYGCSQPYVSRVLRGTRRAHPVPFMQPVPADPPASVRR
jgi:hypothetical protein